MSNVYSVVLSRMQRMLKAVSGLKVLLLDDMTKSVLSLVMTQTRVLESDVIYIDVLANTARNPINSVPCIAFLRPSAENISLLSSELRHPRYREYYLFFSNMVDRAFIEDLAENDVNESISQMVEIFADVIPIAPFVYSMNIPSVLPMQNASGIDNKEFNLAVSGIFSTLFTSGKRPVIRFEGNSLMCRAVADSINSRLLEMSSEFSSPDPSSVLLILDRRVDPVTPLLTQWTYQAMVGELLGICNGMVDLKHVEGIHRDMKEVILSAADDEFFASNMVSNFGQLGANLKVVMDAFSKRAHSSRNLQSIKEMKTFVESLPEYREQSLTTSKHVTLVAELSRLIEVRKLFMVSEVEQNLACVHAQSDALRSVSDLVRDPEVCLYDSFKLILLFCLRYSSSKSDHNRLLDLLVKVKGGREIHTSAISRLLEYCSCTDPDLFKSGIVSRFRVHLSRGLKGMDNVYTQHVPFVKELVLACQRGKLRSDRYPVLSESAMIPTNAPSSSPTNIHVVMLGGATYAEVAACVELNGVQGPQGGGSSVSFLLGATSMINSAGYISDGLGVSVENLFGPSDFLPLPSDGGLASIQDL